MHIFISAGEPSGDLHGSNLVKSLRVNCPNAKFEGFGGHLMSDAGVSLHFPLTSLSVMWFGQVISNIQTFGKLIRQTDVYFRSKKPDAVILIDYPGFNFALAKRAHRAGIPVYYFVPPQLWGWAGWRSRKMQKWVRLVLTALPFEDDWYQAKGVKSQYVGHPYFDELAEQQLDGKFLTQQQAYHGSLVAILPGSRKQEVSANFPLMLAAARHIHQAAPSVKFLVAAYNSDQANVCRQHAASCHLPIEIHVGKTAEIIELADVAMAVSGSVSLELMTRLTPTVVVYRVSPLFKSVAKQLATCRYISLVNLLANEPLFPEYIPTKFDPLPIANTLLDWLQEPSQRQRVVSQLQSLRDRVATPGACSRAAQVILNDLNQSCRQLAAA